MPLPIGAKFASRFAEVTSTRSPDTVTAVGCCSDGVCGRDRVGTLADGCATDDARRRVGHEQRGVVDERGAGGVAAGEGEERADGLRLRSTSATLAALPSGTEARWPRTEKPVGVMVLLVPSAICFCVVGLPSWKSVSDLPGELTTTPISMIVDVPPRKPVAATWSHRCMRRPLPLPRRATSVRAREEANEKRVLRTLCSQVEGEMARADARASTCGRETGSRRALRRADRRCFRRRRSCRARACRE